MSKLCIISLLAVSCVLLFAQSVRSEIPPASSFKDNNPYVINDINKQEVIDLRIRSRVYNKCWKKPKLHTVCLRRTPSMEYFTWNKKTLPFEVRTAINRKGNYVQTWEFENGTIELHRGAKGNITQSWELPNTTWKYTKSANGEVSEHWEGEKDEKAVQHYKSQIDSWCAENDFYMDKNNCVIY